MPVLDSGCPAREGGTRIWNSLIPSPNTTVASPLTSAMMLSTPSDELQVGQAREDRPQEQRGGPETRDGNQALCVRIGQQSAGAPAVIHRMLRMTTSPASIPARDPDPPVARPEVGPCPPPH